MRWLLGLISAALIFVLIYLESAATSLARLAAAVGVGDGAAVFEQIDVSQFLARKLASVGNIAIDGAPGAVRH